MCTHHVSSKHMFASDQLLDQYSALKGPTSSSWSLQLYELTMSLRCVWRYCLCLKVCRTRGPAVLGGFVEAERPTQRRPAGLSAPVSLPHPAAVHIKPLIITSSSSSSRHGLGTTEHGSSWLMKAVAGRKYRWAEGNSEEHVTHEVSLFI